MQSVHTINAPQAVGPYSQAVRVDGWIYCSGQIAIDPATNQLVPGDAAAQAKRVLANLSAVLAAAGASLHHVVKTTVYLKNMDDFATVNTVYAEAFGDHRPARACVEVARLPKEVAVEMDAIAYRVPVGEPTKA